MTPPRTIKELTQENADLAFELSRCQGMLEVIDLCPDDFNREGVTASIERIKTLLDTRALALAETVEEEK